MSRKFKVSEISDRQTKKITSYTVNDAADNEELQERPKIAIFPISILCDKDTQEQRAQKFTDYLNSIAELAIELEQDQKI